MALALADLRKPTSVDEALRDLDRHGIEIPVPRLTIHKPQPIITDLIHEYFLASYEDFC